MSASVHMTAQEFIDTPAPEHGRPWNLIDGEVVVNQATWTHAEVQSNLLFVLTRWTREAAGRGNVGLPIDVRLDDRNVYAPDIRWYREERIPDPEAQAPYPMPDLAVEVRSPSTWRYDIGAKRSGYERHGLPELWLVDNLARTVLVYRRSGADATGFDVSLEVGEGETLTSPLLPGFAIDIREIFEPSTVPQRP